MFKNRIFPTKELIVSCLKQVKNVSEIKDRDTFFEVHDNFFLILQKKNTY